MTLNTISETRRHLTAQNSNSILSCIVRLLPSSREFVSDFELMLARRKEEMNKRRKKKKDSEIINDNDDLIAELIKNMKEAAEEDRALNDQKKPAIRKLRMLPHVMKQLRK